ncbi:type II secretion system protein [Shewanella sp. C32]|uniref:Type II secretion system protein n=1 Tax=Shewanella electrica TaxID=515560 RepID=A0ABT2FLC1_9GAMM|nr:prepilin-type N-terminal cleavage/methylation domain-containing protein [Shewanella electrica]MCH1924118.1 type II secretion system protein [Shewanella electrica]MCS4556021.1 type II secretion system protein [Shewanella electrica]
MQKQQGFTLIELVVVIIILGILAVVAAPKFLNLQSDARGSTLQGLKGAINSANSLVYSKAVLASKEKSSNTTIDINDTSSDTTDDVAVAYGYMKATAASLKAGADLDIGTSGTSDWVIAVTGTSAKITQSGAPADGTDSDGNSTSCSLTYTESTGQGVKPTITVDTSGC